MKKRKLKTYLDKEWKPVKKALKSYLDEGDPEGLHRFRVQVKKIRAFIELAEQIKHPLELKRCFKPVKKIFHLAGEIRDAQLQLKLGITHHADKAYKEKQRKIIKTAGRKLKAKEDLYLKQIRKSRKSLEHRLHKISNREIKMYYTQQLDRIAARLDPIQSVDHLHPGRKLIKILLYDHKLAGDVLSTPVNIAYLKQLGNAIGDWHDNWIASHQFPELKSRNEDMLAQIRKMTYDFHARATAKA